MNDLPDKRLCCKREEIVSQIQHTQSVIIHQMASAWSTQMSYYRFFGNQRVTEEALGGTVSHRCTKASEGRHHVLCLSDTTQFDYSRQREQVKPDSGLGYIGDHRGWGYYAHVSQVIDPQQEELLGLSDIKLWHRSEAKRAKKTYSTPLEEKESYRWIRGCEKSGEVLAQVPEVTFVQDREGDCYDTFVRIPEQGRHLLIRSRYDRSIITPEGEEGKLRAYLKSQPLAGTYQFEVADTHKRTAHTALMELRYTALSIKKGESAAYQAAYPPTRDIRVVYAKERPETVPPGEEPIEWYLLTTHQVESFEDARRMIYWYTLRWLIEEFFRLLKKKGFQLEEAELETGHGLRKLGIMTMDAATRAMQLKQARDGKAALPIEAVFSLDEKQCLEKVGPTLEGKTQKQQNPYPKQTLPWASWIIARLGGWKGYQSQSPPGVITFKRGLDRFEWICLGYHIDGG